MQLFSRNFSVLTAGEHSVSFAELKISVHSAMPASPDIAFLKVVMIVGTNGGITPFPLITNIVLQIKIVLSHKLSIVSQIVFIPFNS